MTCEEIIREISSLMPDYPAIYETFNEVEGAIWLIVAVVLPFLFPRITRNQKLGIGIASVGFIAFGISDFIEARIQDEVPIWLLAYKVLCGAVMMLGRYIYIGWNQFRLKDPCFLFGVFCLIAVIGIIVLRSFT